MPQLNKTLLRISCLLHSALCRPVLKYPAVPLPVRSWSDCLRLSHSLELCAAHGWNIAGSRRKRDLVNELDSLQQAIERLSCQLQEELRQRPFASDSDLYRDLVALAEEFAAVEYRGAEKLLCATTAPITLEGIDLGPFEIRLACGGRDPLPSYKVIALAPNPASSNPDVTHPHINDGHLCEGDGRRAIASALAEGRLFDFFTIVNQLLHTYAEGRAYVELESWHGVSCHDCGDTVDEEERYCCSRCDQTLCGDCTSSCGRCGEASCCNCTTCCPDCEQPFCSSCLLRCHRCERDVCRDCLNHNLCQKCYDDEQENEPNEEDSDFTETPTDPALQSDRLGQAAVSA